VRECEIVSVRVRVGIVCIEMSITPTINSMINSDRPTHHHIMTSQYTFIEPEVSESPRDNVCSLPLEVEGIPHLVHYVASYDSYSRRRAR